MWERITGTAMHPLIQCPYLSQGQCLHGSLIIGRVTVSNRPKQNDDGMRACCIMDFDRLQRSGIGLPVGTL